MNIPFRRVFEPRFQQTILLLFLAFAVLWRGGKSLDATWLLTGVAAFLTIASFHQNREEDSVPRALWLVVMGFVLLTVLSYVFSSTGNYGLDEVLQTASLTLIFFWVARLSNMQSATFNASFTRVLTTVTLLACVIGVFVYVLQPVDRFVGTFFDHRFHTDYWPNAFAEFLLLAWPLVLAWTARDDVLRSSFLRFSLLGFIIGCLLLTYSRGALIAFGGQIVLLTLLFRPSVRSLRSRLVGTVIISLLTFFAVNAMRATFFPVQSVAEKVAFTAPEGGSSVSERKQFFLQAAVLTAEKPFLGWGPYSFRFVQPQLQTGVLQTSDHPHNVLLKLGLERGIAAAVLFAIIVGYVLLSGFRMSLRAFEEPGTKNYQLITTALCGVLAHNLIDYNLQFVGVALPFWILMGSLVPPVEAGEAPSRVRSRRCWELILVSLLLLVSFREGIYLATSSLGRHAEARGEVDKALRWYGRSRSEWFSRDLLLSQGRLLLFEKGDVVAAEETFSRFLAINDEDTRGHRLFGDALRKQGNLRRAELQYRRAYDLGKWNDLSSVKALLSLYLQEGNTEAIDDWKGELLNLIRSYRVAIAENAHYIALGPNVEALLDIYQMLRGVYAEDDATIAMWMEEVNAEAEEERSRLRSRGPGWLW